MDLAETATLKRPPGHLREFWTAQRLHRSQGVTRTPLYYIVQPWGRDRYRQAGVTSVHDTVADAYAKLDAIAAKLQRDGAPPDYMELYVVGADR